MENRICILTLFVFLFLLSGESRAMVAMPDAWTRMMIGVNQKDWSLLRENECRLTSTFRIVRMC